ncbi:MAG: class II glutamine amidotransferase [Sneathiellaceae bacterium]
MCRFLAYKGRPLLMADLLVRARNSLIVQSQNAHMWNKPVNGDGFGVGWFPLHDDPEPGIFRSVEPAWSNANLNSLAHKVVSHCFFAHVRDATAGSPVSQLNCHPFSWGRLVWMHNGALEEFDRMRRPLTQRLSDRAYDWITGSTDTELAFALFLDRLGFVADPDAALLSRTMTATIAELLEIRRGLGIVSPCFMNFAVSNGRDLVATRFVSDPAREPHSLYSTTGALQLDENGRFRVMRAETGAPDSVIVASEPLTAFESDWEPVPPNTLVQVDGANGVTRQPLRIAA